MTTPTQTSVIPESHADLLEGALLAHMASLRPDGTPQNNPVWFEWDGTYVKVSNTRARQKMRNIEHEPRAAFSIVDPENPYRYLEVRAVCERVDDDEDVSFIDSLSERYIQQRPYPWHQPGDQRVVLYFRPTRTSTMG